MTANDVHKIVQALTKDEQQRLYILIGNDLGSNVKPLKLKSRPFEIDRQQIRNRLLKTVFNVDKSYS